MNKNIKSAIVVEGGGMRGIFSAGILDCFYENRFNPFDIYIGVSAGACNLASFLSGQYGRNFRCYTDYMRRPEFFSMKKFLMGGHFMDLDWFWNFLDKKDRLDTEEACSRPDKHFYVTATDVHTGEACYMKAEPPLLNDMLKASSSVPVMYRKFINLREKYLTDGGVSDSIPAEEAYRMGARKIMVVRSRPADYVKKSFTESSIIPSLFLRYPALRKAMKQREEEYMNSVRFIRNPPADAEIIQICPDSLKTGRTTKDLNILHSDYSHGLLKGIEAIKLWNNDEK